jgi:hypothetical protein
MVETRSGRRIHMTVAEVAELGSARSTCNDGRTEARRLAWTGC